MRPPLDWASKQKSSTIREEQVEARQTRIAMLQSSMVRVVACLASYEFQRSKSYPRFRRYVVVRKQYGVTTMRLPATVALDQNI
jgi:hypothetical protein